MSDSFFSQFRSLPPESSFPIPACVRESATPEELRALTDFKLARSRLICGLVSMDLMSAEADRPFLHVLDLALVCYLLLRERGESLLAMPVRSGHMGIWHIKKTDLFRIAEKNTIRRIPPVIRPITEITGTVILPGDADIEETLKNMPRDEEGRLGDPVNPWLSILSNRYFLNGAVCMLYPGVVKKYADACGKDVILFPSSIHEMILQPMYPDAKTDHLNCIVRSANRDVVTELERLSDHVYFYHRGDPGISMPDEPAFIQPFFKEP